MDDTRSPLHGLRASKVVPGDPGRLRAEDDAARTDGFTEILQRLGKDSVEGEGTPANGRTNGGRSERQPVAVVAGDTVIHDKWGEGVVLSVSGAGDRAEATVSFEDVGEKRILLAYAPLAKL